MKNQNTQDILNEIRLRINYDPSKTLTENKSLLSEQKKELSFFYNTIDDKLPKIVLDNKKFVGSLVEQNSNLELKSLSTYTGISGPIFFEKSNLKGISFIKKRTDWLKDYTFDKQSSGCSYIETLYPISKNQDLYEKKFNDFFNTHVGQVRSFTLMDGSRYFATPLIGCNDGNIYFGGYKNTSTGEMYVPPKLSPKIDLKIKETSDSLIAAADDDVMSSPEKFAKFLYKLRDIVSSVEFQIFAAALSISIAVVAGPVAALFSKLLDWGIDVIVLIADLIAALMYPENTLHFEHLGQDVINIGLSFGIMGLFKLGAKTLKEAVNLLTPELKLAIKQFREWITSSLNKIISMVEGTSISGFLKTFKEWVENLFDKNFGKIFSSFVLIGLPVSTMIYLSMLLAEPLFKKIEGPLSTIVGIPLVWLKDWRLGDEIPAEYAQKLEKINPKMQEGQSEELEKIEQSSEKPTEQDLLDKNSEKMQSISKTIIESNEKLKENNNQEYCNRLISHLSEPCKGYLEKKLTENKVNFAIEGENSGLLMVDNIGYIIEWIPSPPRLLDTSEKELTCIDDNTLPSPVSKG